MNETKNEQVFDFYDLGEDSKTVVERCLSGFAISLVKIHYDKSQVILTPRAGDAHVYNNFVHELWNDYNIEEGLYWIAIGCEVDSSNELLITFVVLPFLGCIDNPCVKVKVGDLVALHFKHHVGSFKKAVDVTFTKGLKESVELFNSVKDYNPVIFNCAVFKKIDS